MKFIRAASPTATTTASATSTASPPNSITCIELGVDAIWITPCFPSPQVDFGYDVSDYEAIDPMYGTLKDFDRLVERSKKTQHPHHSGFRRQPHLRPTQMVHRLPFLQNLQISRLVYLARRQRRKSAAQQLALRIRRPRAGPSTRPPASGITTIFIPSSRTSTGAIPRSTTP